MGDNPERMGGEASFAALCGVSPVECSSGSRQYRRLNRGGDRQANAALHRIVQTRLRFAPRAEEPIPTRPEHAGGEGGRRSPGPWPGCRRPAGGGASAPTEGSGPHASSPPGSSPS
ncbi:transposase [Streptomyces platensis]|uniref:transposase n=1 Tax=Streptomyces platensis TaxID=58346 RepID=UPI0036CD128F